MPLSQESILWEGKSIDSCLVRIYTFAMQKYRLLQALIIKHFRELS